MGVKPLHAALEQPESSGESGAASWQSHTRTRRNTIDLGAIGDALTQENKSAPPSSSPSTAPAPHKRQESIHSRAAAASSQWLARMGIEPLHTSAARRATISSLPHQDGKSPLISPGLTGQQDGKSPPASTGQVGVNSSTTAPDEAMSPWYTTKALLAVAVCLVIVAGAIVAALLLTGE